MMPTWLLIVALVLFPTVVALVCGWAGVDPPGTLGLATVVTIGPFTVAIVRALAAEAPTLDLLLVSPLIEWTIAAAPMLLVAAMLGWGVYRERHQSADRFPAARCARCGAALHTDHADRYFSDADGYLCPPAFRQTGGRRHQPSWQRV